MLKKYLKLNVTAIAVIVLLIIVLTFLYTQKTPTQKLEKETDRQTLNFPLKYFPESGWLGGTDTWAQFSGEVESRSYPTTIITISNDSYSNEKHQASTTAQLLKDGEVISGTAYFDVDNDGSKEQIVSICSDGANHCPDRQEIVKGGKVIFTLVTDGGWIDSTATLNGFYANWYKDEDFPGGRCCATGNTRTRFVYKNGLFVPIFEQQIGYIEVEDKP